MNVVNLREDVPPIDFVKEGTICMLWGKGFDTWEIARKVGVKEWQVYNLLARMKEGRR
jgi:hypothetical protein